ncbi:integrase, catalytic region, zinc finger, CCHC-type containing protein [Tanacetum coccineum]
MFCYFDAFLTSDEPKNYNEALKESCWIEAMQEELNEFKRLEVWELISHLNRVMIITFKWIFKVKLDELGGVFKNNARLVERGYHQEEGINFEESFAQRSMLHGLGMICYHHFYSPKSSPKGIVDPTLFTRKEGKDILQYCMESSDLVDTPMVEKSKMDAYPQGKEVDPTCYRGMIGSFMYLTTSRPDLVFDV